MESSEFKKLFDTEKYTVEFNGYEFKFIFESGVWVEVDAVTEWDCPTFDFTSSIERDRQEKERQQRIQTEKEEKEKKESFLNKLSPELRDELNQFYSR